MGVVYMFTSLFMRFIVIIITNILNVIIVFTYLSLLL